MAKNLRIIANTVALMAVLLAQLAMAHHLSVHLFEHDGNGPTLQISMNGHTDPGRSNGKADLCDICVAEKAIGYAISTGMIAIPVQNFTRLLFDIAHNAERPVFLPHCCHSRDPPSLS